MVLKSAIWVFFLLVTVSGSRIEYCGSTICENSDAHTFCKFSPGPGPYCTGYIEASLTVGEQSRLLARLNQRRNDAASGRLRGLPTAGNMFKLRWVEELAKEAQLWANQCSPPNYPEYRDECRDLYSISVGQCVASVVGEAPGLRVESMVDLWYMQGLLYKGNITSYIPPQYDRHFYGDFGQIFWDRSFMVGCGRSKFMSPWQGRLQSVERLVCNVAPAGPIPYRPLWSPAAPASICSSRSHPDGDFPALCDNQLRMNESNVKGNTTTIEERVLMNLALETENNESLFGLRSLDEQYLANLAIVAMNNMNTSSTLHDSSLKRNTDGNVNGTNDVKTSLKTAQNISSKVHNYKTRTIGRPTAYNIEELTEIGDGHNEDNHEIIGEVPRNYIYDIYDTGAQENEILVTEAPKIENISDVSDNNNERIGNTAIVIANENISINENYLSTIEMITDPTKFRIELNMNVDNTTLSEKLLSKDVDDYLNDPETVRELQYALNRLESDMLNSKITSKVRRELKDSPQNIVEAGSERVGEPLPPQRTNKTVDRGPMLNMVLKYMPYLKEYENDILGKVNSANRVPFGVVRYAWILYFVRL